MRATIVIPSYWGRLSNQQHNMDDAVYDHPTPLDQEGSLGRALESIKILENTDFNVVVLAAATNSEFEPMVEEKVQEIVSYFRGELSIACVSHSFEQRMIDHLAQKGHADAVRGMISLTGYSNIRNMCLVATELAGSEVAVLFDDDEVYEDPKYMDKVLEGISGKHDGKRMLGLAGYYERPEGGYMLPPPEDWWMSEWPMVDAMNAAFRIIGEEPRYKPTPFVFGGNMSIHRDLFRRIPFDPNVRRGEDIDYLTNCKFFDIDFILDRELSIRHLPPKSMLVPEWQHFRENIYRFVHARDKLARQKPREGMRHVGIEELDPYPGRCMRSDLEDMIFRTSMMMGLRHLESGDRPGFHECMKNVYLMRHDAPPRFDGYQWYVEFQRRWEAFMSIIAEDVELHEDISSMM